MPSVVMKQSAADAHDCEIRWEADFARMTLRLQAGFISPALLLDFLWQLPHKDDRFVRTGIVGAAQITRRFDVRLELPSGTLFKLLAHQAPAAPGLPLSPPQLECFEVTQQD